ncbi:MAG: hypothetical protein V9E99_05155 [Microthrixaceae bacterium]
MRGTIQKKGKKWYAVVYDGVNPATGNYRRRWVQAGTRRADAEKLLAELVKRAHRGETVVSEKLTLGQYLTERWLPIQEARLRASTYDVVPAQHRTARASRSRETSARPADARGHRHVLCSAAQERPQEAARREGSGQGASHRRRSTTST